MPITAYSNEAKRELDLEQWLALNAYSPQADPQLFAMPDELRAKATRDIECSGCRARGALLVRGALSRANGKPVGQAHFRFGTAGGANPHHPLCDFVEEGKERRNDYLASFANDRSALTRAVRDLVCRGIQGGMFTQGDMREMRLWFLEERSRHAVTLDVTPTLLQWCADMQATEQGWSPDQLPFSPEHGRLPGFDWDRAANREWKSRNKHLFKAVQFRVHFRRSTLKRPLQLLEQHAGATVLDPSVLREKYEAVILVAGFAAGYVFKVAATKPPTLFRGHVSDWGAAGHALLALSSLLLYLNDWDADRAGAAFSVLAGLAPSTSGLEGNLIGLNPFHDYPAWQVINSARHVAAVRTDTRPVVEQVNDIKAELTAAYGAWAAGQQGAADIG